MDDVLGTDFLEIAPCLLGSPISQPWLHLGAMGTLMHLNLKQAFGVWLQLGRLQQGLL